MRKLVENAAGKFVPDVVNGCDFLPFQGVGKHIPAGRKHGATLRSCAHYPADGNKLSGPS